MAVNYSSVFSQIYSPPNKIRRDVLRNLRLGNRDPQIIEFLKFCDTQGIKLKVPPLDTNAKEVDAVSKAQKISPESARWYIYLQKNPANFKNEIEAQNYFRVHMLAGQTGKKVIKDYQLNEFVRLLVSAIGSSNEQTQATLLEQVYVDFLMTDPSGLNKYGWEGKDNKKSADAAIRVYIEKKFPDKIKEMSEELKIQLASGISGLARTVSTARGLEKKPDTADKKYLEFGKAYKYLIEVENIIKSIEKKEPALLKTKGYKRIIKEIDRLYKKERPLTLQDVGLLVYRININRNRLFGRKGKEDEKFRKIHPLKLEDRFWRFIQSGFKETIDPKQFKKAGEFSDFQKLRSDVRSNISELKNIRTKAVHVTKKVRLRAQKVADAFGESLPSFGLTKSLRKSSKKGDSKVSVEEQKPTSKDKNKPNTQ